MKKSFLFFVVLLILAVSGTVTANALLLEQKDAVVITENVVYGDKSIVDGVTVVRNTKYHNHMQWKTLYQVGEVPKCQTEYDFSASGALTDHGERSYEVNVYLNHTRNVSRMGEGEELYGLELAYKELLDETEPGSRSSKKISLADYQKYYTVDMEFDLPGYMISTSFMDVDEIRYSLKNDNLNERSRKNLEKNLKIIETFHEIIKIPVLDNHIYHISVEKDLEGQMCSWGYSSLNGGGSTNGMEIRDDELPEDIDAFNFWISSAITEDTCYFTFNTRTSKNNIVDTSQMPQGYGVYAFTFDAENGEIAIDEMKNVCPLNPKLYVLDVKLDKQQENLLIFTEEEGMRSVIVMDRNTMEQKQQLTYASETEAHHVYIYEDFMVVRYAWEKFVVLARNADGTYQHEIDINCEKYDDLELVDLYSYGGMVFDWNGETLLMSDALIDDDEYYYRPNCGFYLAAFDKEGLQYYGEYESSLDTHKEYIHYYFNCMPTEVEPLFVQW